MHDGLWVLDQFCQADKDVTIKVRVRGKSRKLFAHSIKCSALYDEWRAWLFAAISGHNEHAGIVEFGVNPRTTKFSKGPMPPCLPLAIAANFRVGRDYTLEERLQQVAFLKVSGFEPSILIQRREHLYGIYLLDTPTDETTRYNLAHRIHLLIHSSQWRKIIKPDHMLPLPGFLDHGRRDTVKLVHPIPAGSAKLYTISEFTNFPDAGKENHVKYYQRADADPEGAKRFLAELLEESKRQGSKLSVLAGAMASRAEAQTVRMRRQLGVFSEPTKDSIPPIDALTALKYHSMTQTYVRQGAGMRREALRKFVRALFRLDLGVNISVEDAFKAIDGSIISQFIELGYTPRAVLDFYYRPGHLCGAGKSVTYLTLIYAKEIKRLRAIVAPPPPPAKNTPLLECVATVCRMLPALTKDEREGLACLRGEMFLLNGKRAYRLYRAARISQNLTPLTSAEVTVSINNCRDSYWLGCRMIDGHKMWGLSLKFLQSLGLLSDTSILKAL